jgi:hypothetical protein
MLEEIKRESKTKIADFEESLEAEMRRNRLQEGRDRPIAGEMKRQSSLQSGGLLDESS